MKVHVVGGGAREHALRHVLGRTAAIVDAPDNADLVVIGPEAPIVDGLADTLRAEGRLVFGPGADGGQLEGSKAWMKQVLQEAGIPTARHRSFRPGQADEAAGFLRSLDGPWVVKTSYLAQGKGVLVTGDLEAAIVDARAKLEHGPVVIEEHMDGPEVSLLCVCDGTRSVPLAPARDYKRVGDGDTGPNTGGMGAVSPVPGVDGQALNAAIVQPTLDALRARGIDYRGVLYAGLMLTADGPKVVEYNVRFGDPEAQVVLPRYAGDLAQLLHEAASGEISSEPAFISDAAVTVVMAVQGYPETPRTGDVILGLDDVAQLADVVVFHAGTSTGADGAVRTAGGRVLSVTGFGPSVADARSTAYDAVSRIRWPGVHFRSDIAAGVT